MVEYGEWSRAAYSLAMLVDDYVRKFMRHILDGSISNDELTTLSGQAKLLMDVIDFMLSAGVEARGKDLAYNYIVGRLMDAKKSLTSLMNQVSRVPQDVNVKVYIEKGGKVAVPARVVQALNLSDAEYLNVILEYKGKTIELKNIRVHTVKSRSSLSGTKVFTIPANVRKQYGIKDSEQITIVRVSRA